MGRAIRILYVLQECLYKGERPGIWGSEVKTGASTACRALMGGVWGGREAAWSHGLE